MISGRRTLGSRPDERIRSLVVIAEEESGMSRNRLEPYGAVCALPWKQEVYIDEGREAFPLGILFRPLPPLLSAVPPSTALFQV
jgi:hypothetical protein